MAQQFFYDFLSDIMLQLNRPQSRIHNSEINAKINAFIDFTSNDCKNYCLNNGSPVSNYSQVFMIQCYNHEINSTYNKQTKERQFELDNQGSRAIHKLIPMRYNIHDYYDGIIRNEIPLLVKFFDENECVFIQLKEKIKNYVDEL